MTQWRHATVSVKDSPTEPATSGAPDCSFAPGQGNQHSRLTQAVFTCPTALPDGWAARLSLHHWRVRPPERPRTLPTLPGKGQKHSHAEHPPLRACNDEPCPSAHGSQPSRCTDRNGHARQSETVHSRFRWHESSGLG